MALSRRFARLLKPVGIDSTEEDTDDDDEELKQLRLLGRKDRYKYSDPAKITFDSSRGDFSENSENEDDTLLEDMEPDWFEEFQSIVKNSKTTPDTQPRKPALFDKISGKVSHAPLDTLRASLERYNHDNEDIEAQVVPDNTVLTDGTVSNDDKCSDKMNNSSKMLDASAVKPTNTAVNSGNTITKNKTKACVEKNQSHNSGADKENSVKKTQESQSVEIKDHSGNSKKERRLSTSTEGRKLTNGKSETNLTQKVTERERKSEKKMEKTIRSSENLTKPVTGSNSDKKSINEKKTLSAETNAKKKIDLNGESCEKKVKDSCNSSEYTDSVKKSADKRQSMDKVNKLDKADDVRKHVRFSDKCSMANEEDEKTNSITDKAVPSSIKADSEIKSSSGARLSDLAKSAAIDSSSKAAKETRNTDNDGIAHAATSTKSAPETVVKSENLNETSLKGNASQTKAKPASSLPPYKSEEFKKKKTFNITPASSFPLDELLPVTKKRPNEASDGKNASSGQRKRHATDETCKQASDIQGLSRVDSHSYVQEQMTDGHSQNFFQGTFYDMSDNPWLHDVPHSQYQGYTVPPSYESENCRMSHFVNENMAKIMLAMQSGNIEVVGAVQEALLREIGLNLQALSVTAKPQQDIAVTAESTFMRPSGFYTERSVAEYHPSNPTAAGDNRQVETSADHKQSEELFHLFVEQCKELVQTEEDKTKLMSLVKLLKNEGGSSLTNTGFTPPDGDRQYGNGSGLASSGFTQPECEKKYVAETSDDVSEQRSPDSASTASLNFLFEGRTMLKGGVKPRHIPKTAVVKTGKGRPLDPRSEKDEIPEAMYIKLPPFVREMWGEKKVKKIIALGEMRVPVSTLAQQLNSSTSNCYNPQKVLQSNISAKHDKPRLDKLADGMKAFETAIKPQSLVKGKQCPQSKNSAVDISEKSKNESGSKNTDKSAKQEKIDEPSVIKKKDVKSESEKKSSSVSKPTDPRKKQIIKIKLLNEKAGGSNAHKTNALRKSDAQRTSSSQKSQPGDTSKKHSSLDEKIANCNIDKFSTMNWTKAASFNPTIGEDSASIPVMISSKQKKDKSKVTPPCKTSLIEIVTVENEADQHEDTKEKCHSPSGTNRNVVSMELDSDSEIDETLRGMNKDTKLTAIKVVSKDTNTTGNILKNLSHDVSAEKEIRVRKPSVEKHAKAASGVIKIRDRRMSTDSQINDTIRERSTSIDRKINDTFRERSTSIDRKTNDTFRERSTSIDRKTNDTFRERSTSIDRKTNDTFRERSTTIDRKTNDTFRDRSTSTGRKTTDTIKERGTSIDRKMYDKVSSYASNTRIKTSYNEFERERKKNYNKNMNVVYNTEKGERQLFEKEKVEKKIESGRFVEILPVPVDDKMKSGLSGRYNSSSSYNRVRHTSTSSVESTKSCERGSSSKHMSKSSSSRHRHHSSIPSKSSDRIESNKPPKPDREPEESRERKRHFTSQELHNNESKKRRRDTAPDEKRRYSHGDTRKKAAKPRTSTQQEERYSNPYRNTAQHNDAYKADAFHSYYGCDNSRSQSVQEGTLDKRQPENTQGWNARYSDIAQNYYGTSVTASSLQTESEYKIELKNELMDYGLPDQSRKIVFRDTDPVSSSSDVEILKSGMKKEESVKPKLPIFVPKPKKASKVLEEDRLFLEGFKKRLSGDKNEFEKTVPSNDKCATTTSKAPTVAELTQEREDRLFLENRKKVILEKAETVKKQKVQVGAKGKASTTIDRGVITYRDMLSLADLEAV